MPADNILVLVVDGLRASALGAYGNTTYLTPALDQFAAESFLLDCCFADSTELPSIYRAFWQSLHPLRPEAMDEDLPSLLRLLGKYGYRTTLITDNAEVAGFGAAADFDECVQLEAEATARADEISETNIANIVGAVCEAVHPAGVEEKPRLVWVHSRGMFGPWDAPLELQEALLDREEGDPAPFDAVQPPDFALADAQDADLAYAVGCAYAAQVMVLDACLDFLFERIKDVESTGRWLMVLVGGRGFELGEHGRIGAGGGHLFAELLHVPMLWRFPDGMGALARSQRLASQLDIGPSLLEWIQADSVAPVAMRDGLSLALLATDVAAKWRDTLVAARTADEQVIRTAEWCLRRGAAIGNSASSEAAVELFVRPDDRWEANNVASLCQDEVAQLSAALDSVAERYRSRELEIVS